MFYDDRLPLGLGIHAKRSLAEAAKHILVRSWGSEMEIPAMTLDILGGIDVDARCPTICKPGYPDSSCFGL
jgi:hypothetical protein